MRALVVASVFAILLTGCTQKSAPPAESEQPAAASSSAAPAATAGTAGADCAGIAGLACGDGLYCSMEPGQCRVADAMGKCAIKPEACTQDYNPVCGCDGKIYPNACGAAAAGVNVGETGECPAPN